MPHKTGETECVRTIMLLVPLYLGQEGSFNVYYLWSKRGEAIRREGDAVYSDDGDCRGQGYDLHAA